MSINFATNPGATTAYQSELRVILFDLDGTLLATREMMQTVLSRLHTELVLDGHNYSDLYDQYRQENGQALFDPEEFIKCILRVTADAETGLVQQHVSEQLWQRFLGIVEEEAQNHLFPEVHSALSALGESWQIGLFSQGKDTWQSLKAAYLFRSELKIDSELCFISSDKSSSAFLQFIAATCAERGIRQVILVDDTRLMLERIVANWPAESGVELVGLYHIDRTSEGTANSSKEGSARSLGGPTSPEGGYTISEKEHVPQDQIATIHTLNELLALA